jgi:hypothetical protein
MSQQNMGGPLLTKFPFSKVCESELHQYKWICFGLSSEPES